MVNHAKPVLQTTLQETTLVPRRSGVCQQPLARLNGLSQCEFAVSVAQHYTTDMFETVRT